MRFAKYVKKKKSKWFSLIEKKKHLINSHQLSNGSPNRLTKDRLSGLGHKKKIILNPGNTYSIFNFLYKKCSRIEVKKNLLAE